MIDTAPCFRLGSPRRPRLWPVAVSGHMAGLVREHRDQPQIGKDLPPTRPAHHIWDDGGGLARAHRPSCRGAPSDEVGSGSPTGWPGWESRSVWRQGYGGLEPSPHRLGLTAPALPWHSDRSGLPLWLGLGAMRRPWRSWDSTSRLLASSDIAEIRVRPGGSSSMVEKRNPIDSVRAVAAAELATAVPA